MPQIDYGDAIKIDYGDAKKVTKEDIARQQFNKDLIAKSQGAGPVAPPVALPKDLTYQGRPISFLQSHNVPRTKEEQDMLDYQHKHMIQGTGFDELTAAAQAMGAARPLISGAKPLLGVLGHVARGYGGSIAGSKAAEAAHLGPWGQFAGGVLGGYLGGGGLDETQFGKRVGQGVEEGWQGFKTAPRPGITARTLGGLAGHEAGQMVGHPWVGTVVGEQLPSMLSRGKGALGGFIRGVSRAPLEEGAAENLRLPPSEPPAATEAPPPGGLGGLSGTVGPTGQASQQALQGLMGPRPAPPPAVPTSTGLGQMPDVTVEPAGPAAVKALETQSGQPVPHVPRIDPSIPQGPRPPEDPFAGLRPGTMEEMNPVPRTPQGPMLKPGDVITDMTGQKHVVGSSWKTPEQTPPGPVAAPPAAPTPGPVAAPPTAAVPTPPTTSAADVIAKDARLAARGLRAGSRLANAESPFTEVPAISSLAGESQIGRIGQELEGKSAQQRIAESRAPFQEAKANRLADAIANDPTMKVEDVQQNMTSRAYRLMLQKKAGLERIPSIDTVKRSIGKVPGLRSVGGKQIREMGMEIVKKSVEPKEREAKEPPL